MNTPTPKEVAREAREALQNFHETPQEHFERLIRLGWINSRGEVTRLLGGDVDPDVPTKEGIPTKASGNGHS